MNMQKYSICSEIQERLFSLKDEKYAAFQAKLMPGVDTNKIIGVRTPELRKLAKEYKKHPEIEEFLNDLPHEYYDERNLHGFIISECKDYDQTLQYLDEFLPHVDNWATCDLLSPKVFKKNHEKLSKDVATWVDSDAIYTKRFGIEMIMSHFLDQDFMPEWLPKIAAIRSEEYYINMMVAWFFTTALAKQWESVIPFIEKQTMDRWTHNKTIQKAIESNRITDEQKMYLRGLKIKNGL